MRSSWERGERETARNKFRVFSSERKKLREELDRERETARKSGTKLRGRRQRCRKERAGWKKGKKREAPSGVRQKYVTTKQKKKKGLAMIRTLGRVPLEIGLKPREAWGHGR